MPLQLLKRDESAKAAQPDLRACPAELPSAPGPDIVARLRSLDNRTPFAKAVLMEAAAEIERLRGAIRAHRDQVWGADEPDHASDRELYRSLE